MSNRKSLIKTLEFASVVGFGLAYWLYDLRIATIVLITLMTAFVVVVKVLGEKLSRLQLLSWLVILVLGGATVSFQDEQYIKWKTSVINGTLSLVFLASHFLGSKTILERFLDDKLSCPAVMLRRLNLVAVVYFASIALLNLYVASHFSTTIWVNFKLFGIFACNLLFLAGSFYYLRDYIREMMEENGS